MKRMIIALCAVLVVAVGVFGQNNGDFKKVEEFDENGYLVLVSYFDKVSGHPRGKWEYYYSYNGKLEKIEDFKAGKWEFYGDDCEESNSGTLKYDEKTGKFESYFEYEEEGKKIRKIKDIGYYKGGKKEGKWKFLIDTYSTPIEGNYKDGKKDGEWKELGCWGGCVGNYKDGKLDGKWECGYEGGGGTVIHNYKEGKLDGIQESYDGGYGFLEKVEYYRDGKKYAEFDQNDGEWKQQLQQIIDQYKKQIADCGHQKSEQCAKIIYTLGVIYYGATDYVLAKQTYQRLSNEYPNSQYSQAAKHMLTEIEILSLPPEQQQAARQKAQIIEQIDQYKKQLKECGTQKSEQCAYVMYALGTTYYHDIVYCQATDYPTAKQTFQRFLNEYPNSQYLQSAKQMLTQIETIQKNGQ